MQRFDLIRGGDANESVLNVAVTQNDLVATKISFQTGIHKTKINYQMKISR